MNRRSYLVAAGSGVSALLAGCVDGSLPGSPGGDGADGTATPDGGETDGATPTDEHPALAVVDAYFAASVDEDLDAVGRYMHSKHPFNPENLDEDDLDTFEFQYTDAEDVESEIVEAAYPLEKIRNASSVAPWFEDSETSLEGILEGEQAALARVTFETTEDGSTTEQSEQFIVLTEDGEWRVFFPYEAPPEVPDAEPVDTERYRVVDRIEFDTETERAKVHLSGVDSIEAEELVTYSSSLAVENGVWSEDSETLPSVTFVTTAFDPAGDEIVVALRFDEEEGTEEVVVHREQYVPEE
jgi:hypothetical protein